MTIQKLNTVTTLLTDTGYVTKLNVLYYRVKQLILKGGILDDIIINFDNVDNSADDVYNVTETVLNTLNDELGLINANFKDYVGEEHASYAFDIIEDTIHNVISLHGVYPLAGGIHYTNYSKRLLRKLTLLNDILTTFDASDFGSLLDYTPTKDDELDYIS